MRCINVLCSSSHGRSKFEGYCARCRASIVRCFSRWFGRAA